MRADSLPGSRPESLLAQALGLFELGQEGEAVDLLKEVLRLAPTSESAIRARLMLRQREVLSLERRWRLDAHAGFEWDDNVILESQSNESQNSNRTDLRGIWGLGATIRAVATENTSLSLGYRFDQSVHHDLSRFDLLTNSGFLSGSVKLTDQVLVRMDALAWNTRQDGDNELTGGTLRPNLMISIGEKAGVLRAFVQYEIFEYHTPAIEVFERDGFSFGGGLEYFVPLPFENSLISFSASYQRNLTQSETGTDSSLFPGDFDGDFDYDSARLHSRAVVMLPWEIRTVLAVGYSADRYHNDNSLHAFLTPSVRKREDDIVTGRVEMRRQLVRHTELEVYWRGTWRMSNIASFDYEQQVVGALIRISTN